MNVQSDPAPFELDVRRALYAILLCVAFLAPTHSWPFVFSAIALATSAFISNRIMGGRTLSRASQAVVAFFAWWFLVGGVARVFVTNADSPLSQLTEARVIASMTVCVVGLPLLAVGVRLGLGALDESGKRMSNVFRLPDTTRGLVLLAATAVGCQLLYSLANAAMPSAIEEVGFLGGTQTNVWWVGVLAACARTLGPLSAILAFSLWWRRRSTGAPTFRLGMFALLLGVLVIGPGLVSGWKAPAVELVGALILTIMFHRQRVPWLLTVLLAFAYVGVLDPTVRVARDRLIQTREFSAESVGFELREAFLDVLAGNIEPAGLDERASALLAPFRGLSELGGEIVRRASLTDGGGRAATVSAGLLSVVPRVFLPSKPDLDIGVAFSQEYGVDLDVVSPTDVLTNISPSIPFDVASQFGIISAVVSFFAIGLIWGSVESVLLGSAASNGGTHPLVGWLAFSAWKLESNVGSWIAEQRDLVIVLCVLLVAKRLLDGRLAGRIATLIEGKS